MNEKEKMLDVSWNSIFKIAVSALALYLFFLLRDVLIWIIFALIISILFEPAINFFKNKGLPRNLVVILIYIVFFGILGSVIYIVSDPLIEELKNFTAFFKDYHEELFERVGPTLKELGIGAFANFEEFSESLQKWLEDEGATDSIFRALGSVFGDVVITSTILILSLFISLEEKVLKGS